MERSHLLSPIAEVQEAEFLYLAYHAIVRVACPLTRSEKTFCGQLLSRMQVSHKCFVSRILHWSDAGAQPDKFRHSHLGPVLLGCD